MFVKQVRGERKNLFLDLQALGGMSHRPHLRNEFSTTGNVPEGWLSQKARLELGSILILF